MLHSGLTSSFFTWHAGFRRWTHWGQQQWWRRGLWRGSNTHFFVLLYLIATVHLGVVNINCWSTGWRGGGRRGWPHVWAVLDGDEMGSRNVTYTSSSELDSGLETMDNRSSGWLWYLTFYGVHVGWKVAVTGSPTKAGLQSALGAQGPQKPQVACYVAISLFSLRCWSALLTDAMRALKLLRTQFKIINISL